MSFEAVASAVIFVSWLSLVIYLLAGLREESLSNPRVRPGRSESRCPVLAAAQKVGAIMSSVSEALARFTAFVHTVLDQVKAAKDTNDLQTSRLADLQAKLDEALSDDAADKATIASLQSEIATLQDSVAAQINAALDSLQNPPAEVVNPAPEAPVVDAGAPVDAAPAEPVVVPEVPAEVVVVEPVVEEPVEPTE